jgi:hypothetical protein
VLFRAVALFGAALVAVLAAPSDVGSSSSATPTKLRVTSAGTGIVRSDVAGVISCPSKCATTLSRGALTLTASADSDSFFLGWAGDCVGVGTCRIEFGIGREVYEVAATFRRRAIPSGSSKLSVTNHNPPLEGPIGSNKAQGTVLVGTSECKTQCAFSFSNGTLVTIRGKVKSGSFAYWEGACRGASSLCRLVVDGSQLIDSFFYGGSPLGTYYGLNVSRAGEGRVVSSPPGISCGTGAFCSAAFESGEKVRLTASPSSRSRFGGWGLNCASTTGNVCTLTVTGARAVSATFRLIRDQLQVARSGDGEGFVTSAPPGISCGKTCSASFVREQTIELHATPGKNSTFTGWSGACSGLAACRVTMSGNALVTARFELIRDQVRVRKTGDGDGIVTSVPTGITCGHTCDGTFARGSQVVLHEMPDASSRFVRWSGACSGTGNCTLPVTGPKNATAHFERLRDTVRVQKLGKGKGRVSSSPAGISCGDRCTAQFRRGTEVVLAATPAAGSQFAGWSGSCSGVVACTVTVTGPALIGARFGPICRASATTGFKVTVARTPRRVLVHVRLAGPANARIRLFRRQTQLAQRIVSGLAAGDRQLRLGVPSGTPKGTYRVGVRVADVCGGVKLFSKKVSIPR